MTVPTVDESAVWYYPAGPMPSRDLRDPPAGFIACGPRPRAPAARHAARPTDLATPSKRSVTGTESPTFSAVRQADQHQVQPAGLQRHRPGRDLDCRTGRMASRRRQRSACAVRRCWPPGCWPRPAVRRGAMVGYGEEAGPGRALAGGRAPGLGDGEVARPDLLGRGPQARTGASSRGAARIRRPSQVSSSWQPSSGDQRRRAPGGRGRAGSGRRPGASAQASDLPPSPTG